VVTGNGNYPSDPFAALLAGTYRSLNTPIPDSSGNGPATPRCSSP
jgi:hypothetical protein